MNTGSLVAICILIFSTLAGLIKPSLLSKIYHNLSNRKFIFGTAVFTALILSTIFVATQPPERVTFENQGSSSFNQDITDNEPYGGSTTNLVEQSPAEQIPVESAAPASVGTPSAANNHAQPSGSSSESKKCDNPQVRVKNFTLFVCIP